MSIVVDCDWCTEEFHDQSQNLAKDCLIKFTQWQTSIFGYKTVVPTFTITHTVFILVMANLIAMLGIL